METVTITKAKYDAWQADKAQMRLARHKQFGTSSEKSEYDAGQLNLFNEVEVVEHKLPEAEHRSQRPRRPCRAGCHVAAFRHSDSVKHRKIALAYSTKFECDALFQHPQPGHHPA